MSEKREYTAEDYDKLRRSWEANDQCKCVSCQTMAFALRIASAVMRPGVIEKAWLASLKERSDWHAVDTIRKALLGESDDHSDAIRHIDRLIVEEENAGR